MGILKRRQKDPRENQATAVHGALLLGLDRMKREGVDRVLLSLHEVEPDTSEAGNFVNVEEFQKENPYHSFEGLPNAEQDMIRTGKSYQVAALVQDTVHGEVSYPGPGVETYTRSRVNWMLPAMKPEAGIQYKTVGGVHAGDGLKEFALGAAKSGWKPEDVERVVEAGIKDYKLQSVELMQAGGVRDSKVFEKDYLPGAERELAKMRRQIESTKNAKK